VTQQRSEAATDQRMIVRQQDTDRVHRTVRTREFILAPGKYD
jgi:hypothetical protein